MAASFTHAPASTGRHAAFVDAGFLKAEGARALGIDVSELSPSPASLIEGLRAMSWDNRSSLLRAYWYDAIGEPGTPGWTEAKASFEAIARTPGIRLRLGHVSVQQPSWHTPLKHALRTAGVNLDEFRKYFEFREERRQKGVDTLLTLDLVSLAQRGAYDRAILIAGDRDFAEPVRLAQDEGRRVYLWVPREEAIAPELQSLADEVRVLGEAELRPLLGVAEDAPQAIPATGQRLR
jgi:uncharacterized LabA/DUF88 family protein